MNFTQIPENLYPVCEALAASQKPIKLGKPNLTICHKYILNFNGKIFGVYYYLQSGDWWIQEKPEYLLFPED